MEGWRPFHGLRPFIWLAPFQVSSFKGYARFYAYGVSGFGFKGSRFNDFEDLMI